MSFQCNVQVMGLTENEPKSTKNGGESKHVAKAIKINMEMMDERASKSETLDKTLSKNNSYYSKYGSTNGGEITAKMIDEFENMKVPVIGKNGVTYYRKPRSDTEFAVATIVHPPEEIVEAWSEEEKSKFFKDAYEVLAEIDPIFRQDNLRCAAVHRDEAGEHIHAVHLALHEDGCLGCSYVSKIDWLQNTLNASFPKMMQARGWDVGEPEQVNYSAMNRDLSTIEDPVERIKAAREKEEATELYRSKKKRNKRGGRSVNEFVEDKTEEFYQNAQEANELAAEAARQAQWNLDDSEALLSEAEEIRDYAEQDDAERRQENARESEKAWQARRDAEKDAKKTREDAEADAKIARQNASDARKQALEYKAIADASKKDKEQYDADIEANKATLSDQAARIEANKTKLDNQEARIQANQDKLNKLDDLDAQIATNTLILDNLKKGISRQETLNEIAGKIQKNADKSDEKYDQYGQ